MQNITIMIRIDIFYTAFRLATQTIAPTLAVIQSINSCIKYLASKPHKPIFYPSNYHDGSNVVRILWSGNQVEEYTTYNCLEFHQYADHAIIINIIRSVLGINYTLLGVAVF